MDAQSVRLVQKKLHEMGLYQGAIDGDRGPKTNAAAAAGLAHLPGERPADIATWSDRRRCIAFLQLWCLSEGIAAGAVDGWWGPQTAWASEALWQKRHEGAVDLWRDDLPTGAPGNPNGWPKQSGVTAFYGPHGATDRPAPPPPLARVPCPWTLKIAWNRNQTRSSFLVHEKLAPSLGRVLDRIDAAYSAQQKAEIGIDLFGGDYAPRKMRGGSSWSMHSWGIAIDFDPERNQLNWGRDRARLAQRDALPFWQAWEAEGWLSLGRARNFDWMHVQAAHLDG